MQHPALDKMSSRGVGKDEKMPMAPTFSTMVTGGQDINGIMSLDDIFDSGGMPEGIVPGSSAMNKRKLEQGGKPAAADYDSDDLDDFEENVSERKRSRGTHRNMTEEQKVERR